MPNLLLQSENLGTTWANSFGGGVTLILDNLAAPDGSTSADKISRIDGSVDGIFQDVATTPDALHTVSAYFKADSSTLSEFRIWDVNLNANHSKLRINWIGGVPTTFESSGSVQNIDYRSVGDDWYRSSYSFIAPAVVTSMRCLLIPSNTVNGAGHWTWGHQLEPGLLGKYIPTGSAAVRTDHKNYRSGRPRASKRNQA